MSVISVRVPLYLNKRLDYLWPYDDVPAQKGQWVEVEVAKKKVNALIDEVKEQSSFKKLKPAQKIEHPILAEDTFAFYKWVASYNLAFPGEAVRAALSAGHILEKPEPAKVFCLQESGLKNIKQTAARQKVISLLQEGYMYETQVALADAAGVSSAVVKGLLDAAAIVEKPKEEVNLTYQLKGDLHLSAEQQQAVDEVAPYIEQHKHQGFLLDGVTGSGKTEVYFKLIEEAFKTRPTGQLLLLVPEISLTPQLLKRFEERFGEAAYIWHSETALGARRRLWWRLAEGKPTVVIGARSALFLPFTDLSLIVVDEEHDSSFKQDDNFRYHGRDMAVVRAHLASCPILLGSATPSLETWQNTLVGKFKHLVLKNRHAGAQMPDVQIVDMKRQGPKEKHKFLSPTLVQEIEKRIDNNEQSLLFLNRRGFAPLYLCQDCGHQFACPSCSVNLVMHGHRLKCHHCGYEEAVPEACPSCESEKLIAFGPGTRRVYQEVQEHFPHARIEIVDRDAVTTAGQMKDIVEKMQNGEIDVLIGTQMIAKGLHFPKLTLVGVVSADMGLAQDDIRATERTFQLLTQVAGRSGRSQKGEVILQTFNPDTELFDALAKLDRDAFYDLELASRARGQNPPFGRLIALILSGEQEQAVHQAGKILAQSFPMAEGFRLLGPVPAPLFKINNQFRYRLLIKSIQPAQKQVHNWLATVQLPKSVRVTIDVDPQSFF